MIKGEKPTENKRYVSEKTASMVIDMMRSVVEEEGGTAPLAKIEGIAVAGKTGTAEKFNVKLKRYADERIASFVGVVPANKPKLAIVVVVDNPKKKPAYGGLIAAPVFKDIAVQSLHYLNAVGDTALLEDDNL